MRRLLLAAVVPLFILIFSQAAPSSAAVFVSSPAPHGTAAAATAGGALVTAAQSVRAQPGDTLSAIAARVLGSAKQWPILWWDNRAHLANPDELRIGQVLRFGHWQRVRPWLRHRANAALPKPAAQPVPASAGSQPVSATASVSTGGMGAFEACVISRESGGNPGIWNASGHWGLFQFSETTWVAYGGSPASFGSASAAEQIQIFDNAMATPGGAGNWAPYDGC